MENYRIRKIDAHTWQLEDPFRTYLYLIEGTERAVLLDAGNGFSGLQETIASLTDKPVSVVLTHGHFDHIGEVASLQKTYSIPVCAMAEEQELLQDAQKNLSGLYGKPVTVQADRFFRDKETVQLAGFLFQVLYTPGHTVGGCCYYCAEEQVLFSGDTLFHGSVGRTDFPTGSMGMLHDSIHRKLFVLPTETTVYPGHGETTDIAYEKRYNPY